MQQKLRERLLCERITKINKYADKLIWSGLSKNHSITLQHVLKTFPDKSWNWIGISYNPSITFQDVLEHHEMPWDWNNLSYNSSITFQDVLKHHEMPWNWIALQCPQNIMRDNF